MDDINDEIPIAPITPIAPETLVHDSLAAPIVHVTQPVSDQASSSMQRIEDKYNELSTKLAEISGKLDGIITPAPAPLATPTLEAENVAEQAAADTATDAVTLTVDDKKPKQAKEQPQERARRGLRHSRR